MGSIDYALAKLLSKRNGYELIEPSEVGEIEVINYLNNAQKVLFSWGTTFMKNYIYISNKCKKIDVLITGHPFKLEFNNATNRDILPLKFKKARIQYHLEPDFTNLYF
jgi:capsular polysaccharide biosynthesis protein